VKIYRFDKDASRSITQYGSQKAAIAAIARPAGEFRLDCIYVDAGGGLGYHQAVSEQLFLVVTGEGEVRGMSEKWLPIHAGQGAFWLAGEWHETRSESGLTALVLEGAGLNLASFMEEVT
jgi:quercetin dioxygenase-like cupin family protein